MNRTLSLAALAFVAGLAVAYAAGPSGAQVTPRGAPHIAELSAK